MSKMRKKSGRESFESIRHQKVGWFNLKTRLTLTVAVEVFVSILISFGIAILLAFLFPVTKNIPLLVQVVVYSLLIATISTRLISKLFFDPIKKLREAMQKVADGDFSVQLDTNSSSREIKEVYAGFNMMTKELSATEILQTDFVSNVSHEFKTPINAIEGYTTLLQGCDNLDSVQTEYVEKILFNTQRLSSLVGNILLLSKIENQTIQTNKTRFRLDEQIRGSIVALEPAWSAKDIEFDVELESIEYVGNENLLHHVWDNIISNAIKFSPDKGFVKIGLCRSKDTDNKIVFTVEDNGPGLSDQAIKHIFDKFYQADSSHKQEGNGLGLALVKRILTIVGGSIKAENLEVNGCRFTVTLDNADGAK